MIFEADVRLGKEALGYFEGTSGDRLECPELHEAETFEVDDDEYLAYRPTCGRGRGGEDFGEERLDVHEYRAPVLLGCDVAIEPLGAHRAEALDVHGATELQHINRLSAICEGGGGEGPGTVGVFTLSVCQTR